MGSLAFDNQKGLWDCTGQTYRFAVKPISSPAPSPPVHDTRAFPGHLACEEIPLSALATAQAGDLELQGEGLLHQHDDAGPVHPDGLHEAKDPARQLGAGEVPNDSWERGVLRIRSSPLSIPIVTDR
jgi:hypothetical protein